MNQLHEAWKDREARSASPCTRPSSVAVPSDQGEQTAAVCRRTANAHKCADWLKGIGVKIISIEIDRLRALVKVQFTPFLWRLFANDCAWQRRRQEGEATIYTWFAVRFGARIEWEEIQCPRS